MTARTRPYATIASRLFVAAAGGAAGLCLLLDVLPPYLLATRVFTVLLCALYVAAGARIVAKSRWVAAPARWFTVPGAAVLALPLLIATVAAFSYLRAPFWIDGAFAAKSLGDFPVFVVSHGWHTTLMFETARVDPADFPAFAEFRAAPWFEAGWGDAEFFQADEITVGITLDALFLPGPSVMHVAQLAKPPAEAFPDAPIVEIALTEPQFRALVRHVAQTAALGPEGALVTTSKGDYGAGSRFVKAQGDYYYPNTCNVWTANGLRAAGLPVSPAFAMTARNVLFQAARVGRTVR